MGNRRRYRGGPPTGHLLCVAIARRCIGRRRSSGSIHSEIEKGGIGQPPTRPDLARVRPALMGWRKKVPICEVHHRPFPAEALNLPIRDTAGLSSIRGESNGCLNQSNQVVLHSQDDRQFRRGVLRVRAVSPPQSCAGSDQRDNRRPVTLRTSRASGLAPTGQFARSWPRPKGRRASGREIPGRVRRVHLRLPTSDHGRVEWRLTAG